MKKLLTILLAIACLLSLCACSSSTSDDGSTSDGGSNPDSEKSFKIGVVQLLQHPALDLATEGF